MTERSESERAELEALADEIEAGRVIHEYPAETLRQSASAIRRLAAQDQKPVAWHPSDDVPNVARGASSQYILAVYRKRSGKVYSFAAEYLNAYPLRYEYGCPKGSSGFCDECSEDGCPTTGWHVVEGADDDGYTYHSLTLDDGDEVKGWREVPQWGEALSPPPAAGWDEATRYLKKIADLVDDENACDPLDDAISYANRALEALRHNAPPDSGAGKSVTDLRIYCGDNPLKWAEEFCQIKQKQGWSVADIDENLMLGWFANAIEQSSDVRGCSALPDHGGADAGVVWRSISEDTRWIDGRDVVLLANDMEVQARYCPGEWCDETPSSPREYSGAVWSCFDDQFQLEIEECSEDPSEWCHDGATHWRPTSELPPTALPDHGGADAGVREIISAVLFAKWSGEAKGWHEGEWSAPDWGAWRNRTKLNPFGLSRTAFEEEADFLLKEVQPALSKPAPVAAHEDDPSADERWQAGLDFAMQQLCTVMGIDPHNVTWDAATEEVEGDVRAVIWNILRAKMGDDWKPAPVAANASAEARLREALEHYAKEYCEGWCEQDAGCAQFDHDCGGCLARRALSAHPHASDCDKQGER